MTPPPDPSPETNNAVSLGRMVDVFPASPLRDFDSPGGQAYAARLRNDSTTDLIAIICNSGLPARSAFVNAMRSADSPCIPKLKDSGVVHWPTTNTRLFGLAFERPLAPRYWRALNETHPVMSEDAINQHFITPLIGALSEFQRTGLMHGGIRPTNLFWHEGGSTPPQLGECLSAPCGTGQPILFETIERAMCPPAGRGPGLHVDDTYALGVTIALVLIGQNPLAGVDDHAILQQKLDRGSFVTIVGSRRLAASHVELLRGLLTDDACQRWTSVELQEWAEGRRAPPKSSEGGKRASRGFDFLGHDYWQARQLAVAMANNPSEALKVIENKSLERWVQRSMDDHQRSHLLTEAIEGLKDSGGISHYEDQLVTRTCIALDPAAPIRYRGISVMPEGIANLLAETIMRGGNTQIIAEILSNQFVSFWINAQKDAKSDLLPLAQQMERVRNVVEKPGFGNGIERALYELNPTLPCLSPMVREQYVFSLKLLLPALERVAAAANRPTEPIDRHIAAYILVQDKRGDQIFEQMMAPGAPQKRGLALLTLYSDIQYRFGPDALPNVAAWILSLLDSAVKRFFSKPMQDKVRKQLKDCAAKGDLSAMLVLTDDPHRIAHDEAEFLNARLLYVNLQKELASVTQTLSNRNHMIATVGRPTAASFASALAILLIGYTIVRAFLQSLG